MSRRALALGAGIAAFLAVVLAITLYFYVSGDAGQQRGLVIRNTLGEDVIVEIAGQTGRIGPGEREHTFVLRREQFPSVVRVTYTDGRVLVEEELAYEVFVDADFRMSVDGGGIYPTSSLREHPTPTPGG